MNIQTKLRILTLAVVVLFLGNAVLAGMLLKTRGQQNDEIPPPTAEPSAVDPSAEQLPELPPTEPPTAEPTTDPSVAYIARARDILATMTGDEKLYQLLFVTPEALTGVSQVTQAGPATINALAEKPVGGIIYFRSNIETSEQIVKMIATTQENSPIPLFIGVDEEGGRVARVTGRADVFPEKLPPMLQIGATSDPQNAYDIGQKIALAVSELGFNVDFAPCADVLFNAENTVIGDRSFGTDAALVSGMVENAVLGLQSHGISAAVKHFPGHGSTKADTHNGYTESARTLTEMRNEDWLPFIAGIDAGVDFVMVSHIVSVEVDASGLPASLSGLMVTDFLKGELGFDGLIITDSMSMGAITNNYSAGDAAVRAISAGIDILLMPESIDGAIKGLREALRTGTITQERIDESVLKILTLKIERGIIE